LKIEVDVSSVQQTGRSLKSAANEIEYIQSNLQRAMSQLTMESRRRPEVDNTFRMISQRLSELKEEMNELSNFSERKGEQFADDDAYGQKIETGKWWEIFKVGVSAALDFVPIIGNAKGLIEAVTGRDLITGDKLAPWERALAVAGPLGKGVRNVAKVVRFADEVVEGVTFVAKHGDDVAGLVKKTEHAAEVAVDMKRAEQTVEVASNAKKAEHAAEATADMRKAEHGAETAGSGKQAEHAAEATGDMRKTEHAADATGSGNHAGDTVRSSEGMSKEALAAGLGVGAGGAVGVGAHMLGSSTKKTAGTVKSAVGETTRNTAELSRSSVSKTGDATKSFTTETKQSQNLTSRNTQSCGGDPIHMGTGDQFIDHTAIKLYGASTWPFIMHYHSGLLQESEMGAAWTHNYAMRLTKSEEIPSEGGSLTLYWNAARRNRYILGEDEVYRTEDIDAQWDELHSDEDGYRLICRKTQEMYVFSKEGILLEHINAEGHTLKIDHNERGYAARLTEEITGRSLDFHYNSRGLLAKVEDAERTLSFDYNERNQMIRFTDPNGHRTDISCDAEGRILSTVVEGEVQFENTFDEHYRIVAQSNGEGHVLRLAYDDEILPGSMVTILTNALGHQTKYVHDARCLLTEIEYPDGSKINYTYNEHGQEESRAYSDGRAEYNRYDGRGRLIQYTDQLGHITSFDYNERGQLIRTMDAEQHETKYHYDEMHRLVRITRHDESYSEIGYNGQGLKSSYRDFNGAIRQFIYKENGELEAWEDAEGRRTMVEVDGAGRVAVLVDALGGRAVREYDGNDNLIRTQNALGHSWKYEYDGNDRLLSNQHPSGGETRYTYTTTGKLATVTDALQQTARYMYDEEDQLVTEINPLGNKTSLEYDEVGRLISVIDPLDRTTQYQYDAAGRLQAVIDGEGRLVQQLTYDQAGNPIAAMNGLGHTTSYRFNHLHQVTEVLDAAGRVTRYKYDELSRLTEVVEAEQAVYRQEYDREDRQISYTDANNNRTELHYDRTGLLTEEKNASGNAILYTYDLRGLLSSRINGRKQSTSYNYDIAGRLTGLKDDSGEITLNYDEDGRVISIAEGKSALSRVYDNAGRLIASTDTLGYTIRYAYDAVSRLTMLTYPDGKTVQYRYNAAGEMVEVKDWRGRLTRYSYDQSGKLAETVRANGSREKRSYDAAGQLTKLTDQTALGMMLQQFRFTYNEIGQIIQEEDKQYTYDQLRRLCSGAYKGRVHTYQYDLGGNLTQSTDTETGQVSSYQYASDNRLQSLGDYPVEMDADGNLLYASNGESMSSYEYDARNHLVKSGKVRYTYNMLGTRTSVSWKGKTTQYVVDDLGELSRVLMELDEQGEPIAYYVYGLGLIGREDAAGNYVSYHSDIRGSTTLLTDGQCRVTDRYTYGIYGEIEHHEGNTRQPFQYNGRDGVMTDPNGLYYMRARYYDPALKRFLNRDVIQGDLTDGQTLNRFAYVNGDPVGYVDPLGLFKCEVGKTGGKGELDSSIPEQFYKENGGMNAADFFTAHSEKHLYKPDVQSTAKATQFRKDIDVAKLREDTLLRPDSVTFNKDQNVMIYKKEYPFNLSTPDTSTGAHRIFINLEKKPPKTNRDSQFPFYGGD
jgi:RHS repeat-associated protein